MTGAILQGCCKVSLLLTASPSCSRRGESSFQLIGKLAAGFDQTGLALPGDRSSHWTWWIIPGASANPVLADFFVIGQPGVLQWDMVDKSIGPLQLSFRLFFVSGQPR